MFVKSGCYSCSGVCLFLADDTATNTAMVFCVDMAGLRADPY